MALTAPSLSPAIVVREFDLTPVVPNVDTSLAGFVGQFKWGPVDVPTIVQSEDELASEFGTPDADRAVDYFSAAQYLRYSGNLIVNRTIPTGTVAVGDSATNATLSGAKHTVKNEDHFESQALAEMFTAKYPGVLGNSIAVSAFAIQSGESATSSVTNTLWSGWEYAGQFDAIPGTSGWASNQSGTVVNDEIHLAVVDSDGLITGTKGTVLETFPFLSVAKGAKTVDGSDNYIKTVLNNGSNYVWFGEFDSANFMKGTNWGTAPAVGVTTDYAAKRFLVC